jgi:hypothetical protein
MGAIAASSEARRCRQPPQPSSASPRLRRSGRCNALAGRGAAAAPTFFAASEHDDPSSATQSCTRPPCDRQAARDPARRRARVADAHDAGFRSRVEAFIAAH